MKKRGQSLGLSIIGTIVVIIIGFTMLNFLTPAVTQFRTDLNCASASDISSGTKLMCLVADTTVIYWIIIVLGIAIGLITSRLLT